MKSEPGVPEEIGVNTTTSEVFLSGKGELGAKMGTLRSITRTSQEAQIFEAAFGLPNKDKRTTKIPSPSNKPDRDSTPPRSNEVFKLSKAPVFLPPAALNTQNEPASP